MRNNCLLFVLLSLFILSCEKERTNPQATENAPPAAVTGLLKELTASRLPSPYYHFEYDSVGNPRMASFASGLYTYIIEYRNSKIEKMTTVIGTIQYQLLYRYDSNGHIDRVDYTRSGGRVYRRIFFTYAGEKLVMAEREVDPGSGFIVEKTITFHYHDDGNLYELTTHRPAIPEANQLETTYTDRFEDYDEKNNTDDFSLLHDEFFDQLILLPGTRFQKNNARKLTRTGDGINYSIDYSYRYNDQGNPLTKTGSGTWSTGTDKGQQFVSGYSYSYY